MESINLYESMEMRAVTGRAIRPGGLALTERALALCRIPDGAKVLDVGCGVGATVEFLCQERHHAAFGVDMSSLLLKEGIERRPNLRLLKGTAESLPFREGSFSALFCECVLSLLPDPSLVLKEFVRVLNPEGVLVLSDVYARIPDEASSLPHLPVRCCIKGAVGVRQIKAWVEESGLTAVIWEDHSALLKQLAAQLIFSFGSLNAFWAATCSEGRPDRIQETVKRAKPGYYLLIARRKDRDHG
jgi:SAM-dependent methyltransferase